MDAYIGTKIIRALCLSENKWRESQNKPELPFDRDGYLIVYPDGYRSWSPKATFENSYRKILSEEFALLDQLPIEKPKKEGYA